MINLFQRLPEKIIFLLFFLSALLFFDIFLHIHPDNRYKIFKFKIPKLTFNYRLQKLHHICWIFNKTTEYQVLISFCSIIRNNPGDNYIFNFVIPVNTEIDLKKFNYFKPPGSEIRIRYFKPEQSSLPTFSEEKCKKSSIIIVKIWLKDILPDVDKVLYLDSDMINVSPLSEIWKFDLSGKTMAVTNRIHLKKFWVNSGFIFYNLDDLRKRPKRLFNCASQIYPCNVDDSWHAFCNSRKFLVVAYRYNVEFLAMILKKNRNANELNEEKNAVFYHLKDKENHPFYKIKRSELKDMEYVKQLNSILPIMEKLFDIRDWVDSELRKLNSQK